VPELPSGPPMPYAEGYGTHLERLLQVFGLEPIARYRLARPPLAQALGQVRYPVRARLQTLEGVAPVQERLEQHFPYMAEEQVQQVALLMGPTGPSAAEAQAERTWKFTDDIGWSLALSAHTATLAVGPQYGDFDEFSSRFRAVLDALRESAGVVRCDRLGLRYVDIAETPPGDDAVWRSWFRPELTGWPATSVVASDARLVASLTQSQLAASPTGELAGPPAEVQGIVRHGYVPANTIVPGIVLTETPSSPAYILDTDIFVEAPQPFDPDELARQLTLFHDQIDRFFRWTLAPEGEEYFGLEEVQ
jgi:uncharacterized protein (TIGR04255 family)